MELDELRLPGLPGLAGPPGPPGERGPQGPQGSAGRRAIGAWRADQARVVSKAHRDRRGRPGQRVRCGPMCSSSRRARGRRSLHRSRPHLTATDWSDHTRIDEVPTSWSSYARQRTRPAVVVGLPRAPLPVSYPAAYKTRKDLLFNTHIRDNQKQIVRCRRRARHGLGDQFPDRAAETATFSRNSSGCHHRLSGVVDVQPSL